MTRVSAAAQRRQAKATRKGGRKDPTPRHIDGGANWTKLRDPDETRRYVLAYEGDTETGAEYYRDLGYVEEVATEKGVRFGAGRVTAKTGQPLRMKGHILMSIARKEYDDIIAHGEDGNTGQSLADETEERFSRPSAVTAAAAAAGLRNEGSGLTIED